MKKSVYVILTCLAIACACTRESLSDAVDAGKNPAEKEMCSASLRLNVALNETKSQYQVSDLKTIHNVWVLGVASDGFWRTAYFTESDLTKEGPVVTCPSMSFKAGSSVTFYVTANMGDLSSLAITGGTATPANIVYHLPLDVNLSTVGMPMAAQSSVVTVSAAEASIPVSLEPLLARLDITINKNGITGSVPAEVLASGELKVMRANRRMRPFGVSCAVEPTDIFNVVIDRESFSTSSSYDMAHSNVILYVPENGMGNLLLPGSTQWDKGNTGAPGKYYATYLEYSCSKNGASDGVDGDLTYRFFLGEDATHNFSVHRNATYECTLDLTWNGLFFEGDWRIDNSDLTDGRRLTISETPHTTSTTFTDMGRLRRNVAAPVYVNFSRDGGTTWVHSAKDIDGWPYGWDLYIDGVKQAAGASATAAGDIGWAYTSAAAGDQIAITPGPSSVSASTHTLQLKSADGRVASNVVSFEVSQSLNFFWPYGDGSYYVAQRPILVQNTGLDDPSATITFAEKNGSPNVEIEQMSKTSMYLNLLAAGEYTIVATASNGQTGEVTFTVQDPVIEQLWTSQELWVDGKASDQMLSKYKTTDGTEMSVSNADNHWGATWFAPSLYERVLRPRVASLSAVSGYAFNSKVENVIAFENNTLYVNTLRCTTTGNEFAVAGYLGRHFKVNVQAGAETFSFETYFKDPFQDVNRTNFNETFHDFTSAFAHMTASQKSVYDVSRSFTFSTKSDGMLYARTSCLDIETTSTIGDNRDALTGTFYAGGNSLSLSLSSGGYHTYGNNDVYIHVKNSHDYAAGGDRAKYRLSKYIGKAKIYMHVVYGTIMFPQSASSQYERDIINQGFWKKQFDDDVWQFWYLCGGFVNNPLFNGGGLTSPEHDYNSFATLAMQDNEGFTTISTNNYKLNSGYGFIEYLFNKFNENAYFSLGYLVLRTGTSHGGPTETINSWKTTSSHYPFCRYNPSCEYAKKTWSDNGLSGYHITTEFSEKDENRNGYLIVHFLQDMPVNPKNGFIN